VAVPEVLIVGGGVIGCAVAYELARHGVKVRLLEGAGLCSGASGANGALVWPQAMARGIGLTFSLANFRLFPALGEELGVDLEYRRTGGLVAVGADQWERMVAYAAAQREIGLPAELLDGAAARACITIAWWLTTFPGATIMLTVLGINFMGDWLRDLFDPRLESL